MKRSFQLICTLFLTLSLLLASCLKDNNNDENQSNMGGGVDMYNFCALQNSIASDPANVALRLNILLATSKSAGTTIGNTIVTINDVSTNLKERLFGSAEVTALENGVYRINYISRLAFIKGDNYREGNLLIQTGGKLLEELGEGEQWVITILADTYLYGYDYNNKTSYYNIQLPGKYEITACGPSSWDVTSYGIKAWYIEDIDQDFAGNWNIEYNMTYSQSTMTYGAFKASNIKLTGTGYGLGADTGYSNKNGLDMTYDITAAVEYRLACLPAVKVAGAERIEIAELTEFNPARYPAPYVKLTWKSNDNSCSHYFLMGYNGINYNMGGAVVDDED